MLQWIAPKFLAAMEEILSKLIIKLQKLGERAAEDRAGVGLLADVVVTMLHPFVFSLFQF